MAVVAALMSLGAKGGYPTQRPHLLSGAAWLPSSQVGQLSLLDGASAEVAAQVPVARSGDGLDAVQQGTTGYAVNRSTGSIRRVDGATFEPSAPVTPIPGAGAGLQAFAGSDALYALESQRGVLTAADPVTLANRGQLLPLAAPITAQGVALDPTGRFWLLDAATGDLVWIHDGQRRVRRNATEPGGGLLTLAGGAPVLVDTQRRTAAILDPGSGADRDTVNLDLRPGERVQVSGSPNAARLYVVSPRGLVIICDLTATACGTVVALTGAGTDLGAAIETGGRLFIPDYTTGQVWIVDLRQAQLVAKAQVLSPKTKFQLLTRDGIVFFNDPESEHAGVLRLDGGVQAVAKYDPGDPSKGVDGPTKPAEPGPPSTPTTPPGTPPSPNKPAPNQPPPNSKPSTPPTQPTPGPTTGPTGPPPPGATVQITLSKASAQVGEDITLRATAPSGPPPTTAQWTFGDGRAATGLLVTHHWNTAQTFQVSAQATFASGQTATASVAITVVPAVPQNVVIPNVIGSTEGAATQTLAGKALVTVTVRTISNTVAAGTVLAQQPASGTTVPTGTQVTITVSSGKRPPFSLGTNASASSATWRSGAGTLSFPGSDTDPRGFVVIRPAGSIPLEDGSRPQYLETHPQWVENNTGWITGSYQLPSPVISGDHFRATIGFRSATSATAPPIQKFGDAMFIVLAIFPNGTVTEMGRAHDVGSDGRLVSFDVNLSTAAGATGIQLRVDAGAASTQDWASWVAPRVEG